MNFIYDSLIRHIDGSIIEEAKTIEQIIDILKYKYQNVPENILMQILNIDPTKKKAYTQWVLSKWDNESKEIERSLKNGKLKTLFDYVQNTPSLQLQTLKTFEDGISKVSVTLKSFLYAKHNDASDDFDIEFDDDNWIIAVPNTSEASERLGKGCKWCTAGAYGDAESYFENYTQKGPLYINFDLTKSQKGIDNVDYPFTRYQFSFEEKQFMDYHNDPITDEFKSIVPQSVMTFYEEKGYDTNDLEDYESRMERYDNARYEHAVYINDTTLVLLQEYNEDLEYNENDDTYCLYDTTRDEQDAINDSYYKKDALVFSCGNNFFILKDIYDDFDVIYNVEAQSTYNVSWESEKVKSLTKLNNIYIGCCDDTNEIFAIDSKNVDNSLKFETYIIGKNIALIYDDKDWFYIQNDNSSFFSLIKVKKDLSEYDFVVYKDVPKNKQQFEINQDGSVECVYDNYNIYEEKNDETKYMYEANLPDGNVLVSYYNFNKQNKDQIYYDVIDAKTRKILLKHFSSFLGVGTIKKANLHLIGVQWENDLMQYFNIGSYTPFGNPHKSMKNGTYCVLCEDVNSKNSILFYDGTELNNLIFTQSIRDILNCKWISLQPNQNFSSIISLFDLEERKYVFENLIKVKEDTIILDNHNTINHYGIYCKKDSNLTRILVDLNNGVVLKECDEINKLYGYNTKDFVLKQGNKLALYSMEENTLIVPYVEATSIEPIEKKYFFIINGDKNSIFDATTQRILYVGNTSDISRGDRYSYFDIIINLGNGFKLGVGFEHGYNIVNYYNDNGIIGYFYSNNPSKTYVNNVPDEIKKIMFNFSPQGKQITENFYKIYKKII